MPDFQYSSESRERGPLDDLTDLISAHPRISAAIAGGVLTGIAALVGNEIRKQSAFEAELEKNPPSGRVAYVVNDEIHVVPADSMWKENPGVQRFQIPASAKHPVWLNSNELVFAASHLGYETSPKPADGKTGLAPADKSFPVISDGIYMLNISTGEIDVLLDPYSRSAELQKLFGDVRAGDDRERLEREAFIKEAKEKHRSYVIAGNFATIVVGDIGVLHGSAEIFAEIKGTWYRMQSDGSAIERATTLPPNLVTSQRESADGRFVIDDPWLGPLTLQRPNESPKVMLEAGSDYPAWYTSRE